MAPKLGRRSRSGAARIGSPRTCRFLGSTWRTGSRRYKRSCFCYAPRLDLSWMVRSMPKRPSPAECLRPPRHPLPAAPSHALNPPKPTMCRHGPWSNCKQGAGSVRTCQSAPWSVLGEPIDFARIHERVRSRCADGTRPAPGAKSERNRHVPDRGRIRSSRDSSAPPTTIAHTGIGGFHASQETTAIIPVLPQGSHH